MTIHVLLVEDHCILREGTRELLGLTDDLEIVAETDNGEEAVRLCAALCPDVVVMDIRLPGMDGLEATRIIHQAQPRVRVLILSAYDDERYIYPLAQAGASGYLLKTTSITRLADAIRAVYHGKSVFDSRVSARLQERMAEQRREQRRSHTTTANLTRQLTRRELEVLRGAAHGWSNREIAGELGIATATVQVHLRSVFAKLKVACRTEAVTYAARQGWINLGE